MPKILYQGTEKLYLKTSVIQRRSKNWFVALGLPLSKPFWYKCGIEARNQAQFVCNAALCPHIYVT